MLGIVSRKWWVLLIKGVAAITLGIVAMAWPTLALAWLVGMFAAFSLIDGGASIAIGFRGEKDGTVWWSMVLLGLLATAAGCIALFQPILTLGVLILLVAVSAVFRGVLEIVAAIKLRHHIDDEWVLGLSGFLSILFGGLIYANPAAGAVAIAILIGAYMLAIGVMAVALSLRLRRLQQRTGDPTVVPAQAAPTAS